MNAVETKSSSNNDGNMMKVMMMMVMMMMIEVASEDHGHVPHDDLSPKLGGASPRWLVDSVASELLALDWIVGVRPWGPDEKAMWRSECDLFCHADVEHL